MKLAIIGNKKSLYSIKRICQEARENFQVIDIYNWKEVCFHWGENGLQIELGEKPLREYTHLLTRISDGYYNQRTILVRKADELGVKTFNKNLILKLPDYNKLIEYLVLEEAGIPVVPSFQSLKSNFKSPFDFPVILKATKGNRSKKVWKVNSEKDLSLELKKHRLANVFIQPFIDTGYDLRIFVVGESVVASYKRIATNSFKSAIDGISENYTPTNEEVSLALSASKHLEADCLGVDIIHIGGKPRILEINIDAGFKTLEEITGVSVAKKIVARLSQL